MNTKLQTQTMPHMESPAGLSLVLLCFYVISCFATTPKIPTTAGNNCRFPAVFNFGDSNSDTGGLSASSLLVPNPPNGLTFFGKPVGRFCDGRLIIDFLAKAVGLPFLSAYLDSLSANFSHGTNFAVTGSTIRPTLTPILPRRRINPFDLGVQSEQFKQFQSRAPLYNKKDEAKNLKSKQSFYTKALYTFDIGQNDLAIGFLQNLSIQEINASIPDIINDFSTNIKIIYDLGGRLFWIHNTGPIGCQANILVNFPVKSRDEAGCAVSYNQLAQSFNHKLEKAIAELRRDLPLASLYYVDIYSIKYSLFKDPRKYGFKRPLVACCGSGGTYNYNPRRGFCGDVINFGGRQKVVGSCKNPRLSVIWDGIHYTEAANKIVFDRISTGLFSDPPVSLDMACH